MCLLRVFYLHMRENRDSLYYILNSQLKSNRIFLPVWVLNGTTEAAARKKKWRTNPWLVNKSGSWPITWLSLGGKAWRQIRLPLLRCFSVLQLTTSDSSAVVIDVLCEVLKELYFSFTLTTWYWISLSLPLSSYKEGNLIFFFGLLYW